MLLDHKIDDLRVLQRQAMLGSINSRNFYWWRRETRRRVEEVTTDDSPARHKFEELLRSISIGDKSNLKHDLISATDVLEELIENLHALSQRHYLVTDRYKPSVPSINDNMVEPELWLETYKLVASEDWGKLISSVGVLFEDRLRKWTVDPEDHVCQSLHSTKLIKAIFGGDGWYRLGSTEQERQGWLELALGLYTAIRNVGNHRIQDRSDARLHASGVLGTASLILNELRYQYGPGQLWA